MISAFANIFKIPELRSRVLFTLAAIIVIRAGSAITTPGVNAQVLRQWFLDHAGAASTGGVERIERGAVTERIIERAAQNGGVLVLGPKAVLTPMGKDRARALGVQIQREAAC